MSKGRTIVAFIGEVSSESLAVRTLIYCHHLWRVKFLSCSLFYTLQKSHLISLLDFVTLLFRIILRFYFYSSCLLWCIVFIIWLRVVDAIWDRSRIMRNMRDRVKFNLSLTDWVTSIWKFIRNLGSDELAAMFLFDS